MQIILIAGLWFPASVWGSVVTELGRLGHQGIPVTLPGQGDGATSATLADQVDAVLAAVDAAAGTEGDPVMVVGHSAASTLAWVAADARPDVVSPVVFIGGYPAADGQPYAEFFPVSEGAMPFPGWEPFAGPDSDDLDDRAKAELAAAAIAVPVGVSSGIVHLHDERRYDVRAVLLCPEFTPEQAREWIESGQLPELAGARRLELVDLDSGHWPMVSRPVELAEALARIAQG